MTDTENLDEIRKILRADLPLYRWGGAALLALGALLLWKGSASVHETADAVWLGGFLVALWLPGVLLVRSGWRSLDRHPLVLALTRHPEWIESVDIAYTATQGGGHRARVIVRLGAHGTRSFSIDEAKGRERELADWILARRKS